MHLLNIAMSLTLKKIETAEIKFSKADTHTDHWYQKRGVSESI